MIHPVVLCLALHGDSSHDPKEFEATFFDWFEEEFTIPPGETSYRFTVDPKGFAQILVAVMLDGDQSRDTGYYVTSWEIFCRRQGLMPASSYERYFDYYSLWILPGF